MKPQVAREVASPVNFTALWGVVDGLGTPVDFILTAGEVHDSVCPHDLLDGKSAAFRFDKWFWQTKPMIVDLFGNYC